MSTLKRFYLLLVTSLTVGGILTTFPTTAQTPIGGSQSDIQGPNIWNNQIPLFRPESGLDPQIISRANEIIKQLNDAYADYQTVEKTASQGVRRFSRTQRTAACINPHTERVNRLVTEARTLLNGVNNNQAEILKRNPAFRSW